MIQLKGREAGILRCIVPDDISEKQLLEEFSVMVEQGARLLIGSKLVIDMQSRIFTPSLVLKIWKGFIEPSGASVENWVSDNASSFLCLKNLGLKVSDQADNPVAAAPYANNKETSIKNVKGMLYSGNLRGGQKLSSEGDIIVMGHVNMGAEVYAGGHIVVLGRLHGVVHAGCGGDNDMSVTVRSIETPQVRIGTKVGMIDCNSEFWGKPTVITLCNEEIVVTDWPSI